jgi:DNA modification methylase
MQSIEDNSINFIFADLPYSDEKIKRVTANNWDI